MSEIKSFTPIMTTTIKLKSHRNALQIRALKVIEPEVRAADQTWRRKYLRDFTEAFRNYEAVIDSHQFQKRIADASLILVGDYHALPACQKFAADLIEKHSLNRSVVLAVETVFSRDQHILDEWWRQNIGEPELRRRIRFNQDWGYDWQPFYDLLLIARQHADAIFGLDCMPREDLRKINARDRHAAHKLSEIRERYPTSLIVTLIGESHLAPTHLPALIRKHSPEENPLTILQNVDPMYWRVTEENQKACAVSVDDATLCVFNATPLEKYESYRACLKRWSVEQLDPTDFAPAIYSSIDTLLRFLDINRYLPRNGKQPTFLIDLLPEVHDEASCDVSEMLFDEKIKHRLGILGCAYVPEQNAFIVRTFRAEAVASEAARFVHHACRGLISERSSHSQLLEDALAYFGSKILCGTETDPDAEGETLGSGLCEAFERGVLNRADLKRIFLSPVSQAEKVHSQLLEKCGLGAPA